MKCCIVLLFAFTITCIVTGDLTFVGKCPEVKGIDNFNETRFGGMWYKIQKLDDNEKNDCGLVFYKFLKNDTTFQYEVNVTTLENTSNTTTGMKLKRSSPNIINGNYTIFINGTKTSGHQIVATEYEDYAVVWECSDKGNNQSTQRLSILGRQNTLKNETLDVIKSKLNTTKIDYSKLKYVEQDNKKCGRSSASALVMPSFISSIIVLIFTKKF